MEIVHRPGKKYVNADGLSRIPDSMSVCDCYYAGADVEQLPCKGCEYCRRAHTHWSRFLNDVDDVIRWLRSKLHHLKSERCALRWDQISRQRSGLQHRRGFQPRILRRQIPLT